MAGQGHEPTRREDGVTSALLVSAHGARVLVEPGAPIAVLRTLSASLPPGMATPVPDAGVEVDARYSVRADGDTAWLILRDGAVIDRARAVAGAARRLRTHVEFDIAVRARSALFVHAGVVAWRGRAVLIPGASNTGKSTLVAELVRRGATYYSDEYAVIDKQGRVHSYARRTRATRPLLAGTATPPIEAAVLIATRYAPGARWAPEVLEGSRAVLPLLDHALAMQNDPRRALRVAARLGARFVALQGPRPDAGEVAPALLEFVDRFLDGMPAQSALADVPRATTGRRRPPRVLEDPSWVPVACSTRRSVVRFRHYQRPFYIAHAARAPRPWDVELPLAEIEAAALPEPARVHFVYHHGYAGSTLLFRLLDVPGVCLAYDEPNVHFGRYANTAVRRLCYRTFRAGETPLIKTLPAEITRAADHFADHPEARGLFLYAPLEEYVAATLAHGYRRDYVTKMARTLGVPECASPAQAAVECWQRIAAAAIELSAVHPLKTIEANAFFAHPERQLARIWSWYGFLPRADWSARIDEVSTSHAKTGRPFTLADRLTQKRRYADGAREWADANGAILAAARTTLAQLERFTL